MRSTSPDDRCAPSRVHLVHILRGADLIGIVRRAGRRLGIKRWLHSTAPAQTKIVYQNEESMRLVLDGN